MGMIFPTSLPFDGGDRTAGSHAQWLRHVFEHQRALEAAVVLAFGGGDGTILTEENYLRVDAQEPPDLTVQVSGGLGFVDGHVFLLDGPVMLDFAETLPASMNRIDLIQVTYGSGVNVKRGLEGTPPAAPAVDVHSVGLAAIALTPSIAAITTGEITDARVFIG